MTNTETRIADLEAAIERLEAQRTEQTTMVTAFPGNDAWALRENYRNEEARRSGLLGIDQSIAAAAQQLEFYRGLQAA